MGSNLLLKCLFGETGWSPDAVSRSLVTFDDIFYQSRIHRCPVLPRSVSGMWMHKWHHGEIRHRTTHHRIAPTCWFCQGNSWMRCGDEYFFPFLCKPSNNPFSFLPLGYASSVCGVSPPLVCSPPSESLFSPPSSCQTRVTSVRCLVAWGALWKWVPLEVSLLP